MKGNNELIAYSSLAKFKTYVDYLFASTLTSIFDIFCFWIISFDILN